MSDPAASTDLVRLFNRSFPAAVSLDPATFYPETVYHYTGAMGVAGILLKGTLWATNFSFLNDPTEVEYGHKLVLKLLQKEARIRGDKKKLFVAIEDSFCERALSEVYVCCFTECRDDLSQWRAYGTATEARYCLGFSTEALYDFSAEPELEFTKVIYDVQEQYAPIKMVIAKTIDFFTGRDLSESETRKIAGAAAGRLARLLPKMKSPAYAAEKEWRVIRWIPDGDVSNVSFAPTRGIVRPYVEFPFTHAKQNSVVELLVLAPGRERPSVKAADMLLRKAGITGVQPEDSKVPFAE